MKYLTEMTPIRACEIAEHALRGTDQYHTVVWVSNNPKKKQLGLGDILKAAIRNHKKKSHD